MTKILITGSTGNVGGEVVDAVLRAGAEVRALVRAVDPAREVDQVVGDLNDPASLAAALKGVDGVFLLPGYQDMPGILAEVRQAGVERVVLLSGRAATATDLDNAISQYMAASESAVRESGAAWTVLRPAAFMANALRWLPQLRAGDVVRDAFGDVPVASIDPYDIGEVAARALLEPGHEGQAYLLSGPEQLLPADRLAVLADVLGRDLRFEAQGDEEARAEMEAAMPAAYVKAFFDFYRRGTIDEERIYPTVFEVTGRQPRTFRQWAEQHASAFSGEGRSSRG